MMSRRVLRLLGLALAASGLVNAYSNQQGGNQQNSNYQYSSSSNSYGGGNYQQSYTGNYQYPSYNNQNNGNYQQQNNNGNYQNGGNDYYGGNNQASNANNNGSGNNYKGSYQYSNHFYNGARDFDVCEDSVVRVTALFIVCDSPYAFYYGNGANRDSPVCNYGDKLSMEVRFEVVDDIEETDPIFITMAVYDDQDNMLISVDPFYLCDDLVGFDCSYKGYYGFTYRLRLPYPSDSYGQATSTSFLPYVHMAFSTKADSGYNLGAVNEKCERWGDGESGYVTWSKKKQRAPLQAFVQDYGLLILSLIMLGAVGMFVWNQAGKSLLAPDKTLGNPQIDVDDDASGKSFGLMD